jgi:hypothetical protein
MLCDSMASGAEGLTGSPITPIKRFIVASNWFFQLLLEFEYSSGLERTPELALITGCKTLSTCLHIDARLGDLRRPGAFIHLKVIGSGGYVLLESDGPTNSNS